MAILSRGTKTEITRQLNPKAAEIFSQWIGCFGVVWNCKVAENREAYQTYIAAKEAGQIIPMNKPSQAVAHFITHERPWLSEVPSQIRRNAGTKFVEALNACLKGIKKAPAFRGYNDKKNCLVTNELFQVALTTDEIHFKFKRTEKTKPFCTIILSKNDRMTEVPKMVWLSRRGSRFFLSYSYTAHFPDIREEEVIIEQLKQTPFEFQVKSVLGIDVGVVKPVAASNGQTLGFTNTEIAAIQRKQKRRLKYQRKMSRQREMAKKKSVSTGKNYQKNKAKLADKHTQIAHLRINMAHRVSKELAEEAVEVIVCEKLRIKNMTGRPKAKLDSVTGKWLVNGASRKAGLNKSILNVGWRRILNYTHYKLRERDKTIVYMPAQYSSQECNKCDFISAENRQSQEVFCCTRCGHTDNADYNSSSVLKKRFLAELNTGKFVMPTKTVKRIAIRRQKAARVAVSVCGAEVRPALEVGVG